jgi:hypothetical protein
MDTLVTEEVDQADWIPCCGISGTERYKQIKEHNRIKRNINKISVHY